MGSWKTTLAILSLSLALVALGGCRTTSEDVQRWANTQQGPRKLVAVLTHAKYPRDLRVEAGLTLIGMRPRAGRRVGIDQALDALAAMDAEDRSKVLAALVPQLVSRLTGPPPSPGQEDESIPYKDAAYSLLPGQDDTLMASGELEQALRAALTQWAMGDFSGRMDAPGQKVSMQQLLGQLGAQSVRGLPQLIVPGAAKVDRIAQLVAEIGEDATKLQASEKLADLAKFTASSAWLDQKRPELQKANEASGIKPDDKAFAKQLETFQEEELLRVFASMRRVGGKPSIDFLLHFAAGSTNTEKARLGALAALERKVDANSADQLSMVLKIAGSEETPDPVRGLALTRMSELPRDKVAGPLMDLFDSPNWKVRWVAAELLLKMSGPQHVEEFMQRLSKVEHMSLTEPLRYGQLIGEMKGEPSGKDLVDSYSSSSKKVPVRLTALGFYYAHGQASDVSALEKVTKDRKKLPECAEGAKDCEWVCANREVTTVGEYVEHCILPAIAARNSGPTQSDSSKPSQDAPKAQ